MKSDHRKGFVKLYFFDRTTNFVDSRGHVEIGIDLPEGNDPQDDVKRVLLEPMAY